MLGFRLPKRTDLRATVLGAEENLGPFPILEEPGSRP
jgi:hypothetical protein